MFSKLMKKTIAVAAAVAMTSVMAASTSPWWSIDFDSYAEGKLPETEAQGSWTQNADDLSVIKDQKLVLDTQGEDLTWTPKAVAENYDSVILDADVKFVASDVEPTTTEDMQTAIYLKALEDGSTKLCAYQTIDGAQVWDALEDFVIADGDTKHVNITIKYNDESGKPIVTVTIGETSASYVAANTTKKVVTSVSFRGTGTIDNFKADTGIDVTYVASVGDEQFETYAAAFAYVAANGGDLKLTGDSEETSFGSFTFTKDATIDLGGKEITAAFVVDGGAQFSIDNGTVTAPANNDVIYIKNGKATVEAGATLYASTDCAVFLKNTTDAKAELALDVYGKLYSKADTGYAVIQGNGLNVVASEIEIFKGAEVAHDFDTAIYHPQNGTLTVGEATIKGTTGIEMRAGSLVVNGATITATGTPASTDENNNGTTTVGAAIALSQHSTKLPTSVEVKAGTLNGAYAFLQYNGNETPSTEISAKIAAGTTINGAVATAEKGFVMPEAADGSYTLATADFIVAGMPYDTFADAYAAAAEGATIEVYTDFSATEIITIEKSVTIEGNGHTLTSTAARAINIDTTGTVVIKDLTINAAERAINIINKPATVTLTGVTATANNNAVMIATSAGAAKVTVDNCDFTGLAVINVAGAGAQVTVADSKITNVDANADENYGAITVWTSAEGATVEVTDSEIVVADDSVKAFVFPGDATVTGVDNVTYCVATVGDAGYDTIEEALKEAKDGDTIVLQRDITSSSIITINKAITLDGNGKTLTSTAARAINVETDGAVIIKDLNIKAAERAINIINEPATVTLTGVTATANNNAVMIATSAGAANVTVKNCDFTGLAVVNVAGAVAQVKIADSKITNVDANPGEDYGAITVWTSAEGASVAVTNSEIVVADDSRKAWVFPADATVTGVDDVGYIVATVGDAGYDTIAEAIEDAKSSKTIILQRDVAEDVAIAGTVTLDLNGKAATGTFTLTDTAAKLYAAKNLAVVTNVDGYEVVFADGCYSVQVVEVEFAPVAVTAIAINGTTAKLTIAGEYTEVKVFFCENLGDEWKEISADFDGSVATVSATTATGFFKVEAR